MHRTASRLAPALLVVLLAVLAACGPGESEGLTVDASEGTSDFRLATLDGRTLGPPDFAGDIVVVDFWATWCTPCRAQARILEMVHAEWQGRGVQFLAVDIAEDRATVESFVADNPFPYPVLLDTEDELAARLGLLALPTVMVVDRQGEIVYLEAGLVDRPALEEILRAADAPV